MTFLNVTMTPSDQAEPASISFFELFHGLTTMFHYSPEDRFIEAQEAADQLEAAQNMPTLEEMQNMNRAELVEATRATRKFDFWV